MFSRSVLSCLNRSIIVDCSSARSLLGVSGPDSVKLLQSLVTNDVSSLALGEAKFAAFLSPQGKVLFDTLIIRRGDDQFVIDHARSLESQLFKHLRRYKLRAAVTLEPDEALQSLSFAVVSGGESQPADSTAAALAEIAHSVGGHCFADPRSPLLGARLLVSRRGREQAERLLGGAFSELEGRSEPDSGSEQGSNSRSLLDYSVYEYYAKCLGIPSGPADLPFDTAFPGEATLDFLNGIDYSKGCYIGQELTARTHHRGTVRKMLMPMLAVDANGTEGPELSLPPRSPFARWGPRLLSSENSWNIAEAIGGDVENWRNEPLSSSVNEESLEDDETDNGNRRTPSPARSRRRKRPPARIVSVFGNVALANVRLDCLNPENLERTRLRAEQGGQLFEVIRPHWWDTK